MAIANSYNFRSVNARVTTSGVVGAGRLKGLGTEGYDVVINLLPDESEYAVENERGIVEDQNVKYVHIPVDFKQPSVADYDRFVLAMEAAKEAKVHIHCAANYRVSAFYALYAESRNEWSQSKAQQFVASLWQPQACTGWPEFIAQVRARDIGG